MKTDPPLQLFLKALGRPAVFEEEKLEPGTFPVLTQLFAFAKNLGDSLQDRDHLMALYKSVQPDRQMGISRKSSADSQENLPESPLPRRIAVRPTSLISG